jgi:type IV secretory pathway VirB4 component
VIVTPEVRTEVWRVLELLAGRPVEDRTLTLFAALMQNQDVRAALHPFTQGGAHGRLIDHDRSTLGYGPVQAFEMDDVLRHPEAAGAVLGALFMPWRSASTGARPCSCSTRPGSSSRTLSSPRRFRIG